MSNVQFVFSDSHFGNVNNFLIIRNQYIFDCNEQNKQLNVGPYILAAPEAIHLLTISQEERDAAAVFADFDPQTDSACYIQKKK